MKETAGGSVEASSQPVPQHSRYAKIIHWGFILVYAYGIVNQVDEVEELEDFALLQEEMIFAVIFLLLLFARFVYMHSTKPSVLPSDTPKRMLLLARTVHIGMYASLAMLALSGVVIGGLFWSGVKGGASMEAVLLLHEIMFWASFNLIALHIAGAIYHRYQGDGVWDAMVPVWKE
ncbi:MAG: hypothetical protein DHS20C12_18730 [Pseudohongiella sp.]|nr:MAG: hypothetical protein DHS20C12_18730 [Pseudohongiella sp.]